MALDTTLSVLLKSTLTGAGDFGTPSVPIAVAYDKALATGTATGLADKIFADSRTLAASANEDLDLAGSLADPLGATLTIVKLKMVIVTAAAGNTNNVRVTRPASNGVPIFLAAGDGVDVLPGGLFTWCAPGAGITVTAGTGDLINIANSAGSTTVTYGVILIGTSA